MWLVAQDAILTKDNMIRRHWQGVLPVISVGSLKTGVICFLLAQWQKWCGGFLPCVFIKIRGQILMLSTGHGSQLLCLVGKMFMCWDWQPYAGQSGKHGTIPALTRNR
jgi:hypothetical protein